MASSCTRVLTRRRAVLRVTVSVACPLARSPLEVALTMSEVISMIEGDVTTRLGAPRCIARLLRWLVTLSTKQFGFLRRSIGTPFSRMQSTKRMEILISRKSFKFLAYYPVLRTFQTFGLDFRLVSAVSPHNSHIFLPV